MKSWLYAILVMLIVTCCTSQPPVMAEEEKPAAQSVEVKGKEYFIKEKKGTFYVTEPVGLNIRTLPDKDSELLGCLDFGETVTVTGYIYKNAEKNGTTKKKKTGWVQIALQGKTAYIKNELSQDPPAADKALSQKGEPETEKETEEEYAQCPYCGDWYQTGTSYRSHVSACQYRETETEEEYAQCPYCGDWYQTGISYRSHVTACLGRQEEQQNYQCIICGQWFPDPNSLSEHSAACLIENSGNCPYCGGLFHYNGGLYDMHVASCPYNPAPSLYTCPYCSMMMLYEDSYTHSCG